MKWNVRMKEKETQQQPQPYDSISFIAWSNVFEPLSVYVCMSVCVFICKRKCKGQTYHPNRSLQSHVCSVRAIQIYKYIHIGMKSEQMSDRLSFRNTYVRSYCMYYITQYIRIASILMPLYSVMNSLQSLCHFKQFQWFSSRWWCCSTTLWLEDFDIEKSDDFTSFFLLVIFHIIFSLEAINLLYL